MSEGLTLADCAIRLAFALVVGGAVGVVYRVSHGRANPDRMPFCTTLVLLAALIAMVTIVIGGSVAKAFSLVGALSIVRFRTIVEDTRDTAFVIFAVVVGMAAGSGYFALPLIGIPLIGATAVALHTRNANPRLRRTLDVTVRMVLGRSPKEQVEPLLEMDGNRAQLRSVATAKQGAVVEYTYRLKLTDLDAVVSVANRLAQLDGVQGVEYNVKRDRQ